MKKLFFAGALALALLTSCQNSDANINQEDQQHQTFSSKTTAREGEESELIQGAMSYLDSDFNENANPSGKYMILCHTSYLNDFGNACVQNGSTIVTIHWTPGNTPPPKYDNGYYSTFDSPRNYVGYISNSCSCR